MTHEQAYDSTREGFSIIAEIATTAMQSDPRLAVVIAQFAAGWLQFMAATDVITQDEAETILYDVCGVPTETPDDVMTEQDIAQMLDDIDTL